MKLRIIKPALACMLGCVTARATTFTIINLDPAGYGFNDPAAAAPVGGNPGTTLGQQRLNVLQEACRIWGTYLHSPVTITVEGHFEDLGGSPTEGTVLAGARTLGLEINFPNAPLPNVFYPAALANSLAGIDLSTTSDISVTINSAPDSDPLLDDWYYGFDGNAPADHIDLLDVLLHELGHGLGMITWCDLPGGGLVLATGGAKPDVYSTFLYDTEFNAAWLDLSKNSRKASALNDPNLVWTGPYTTAASGQILAALRVIEVTAPAGIAGEYAYEAAAFTPALPDIPADGITAPLVIADDGTGTPTDACEPLLNDLTGSIALIDRGTCNFDSKVLNAQAAGAVAVIVANNQAGSIIMSGDGTGITIPAVSISQADGQTLKAASPGVVLTLGKPSAAGLAGTNGGYVRIYAPNPWEQGSSGSHWSTAAAPDLLMEPFINPVLREDLDLSLTQMKDIGWVVIDIPYPHLTYALWGQQAFSPAATLTAPGDDPDGDGITNIEEYFFGGDPESPSGNLLPVMQAADPDLDLLYTRSTLPADLVLGYEVSTDMAGWTDALEGVHYTGESVTDLGGGAQQVRLSLVPPAPGAKVFIRIRVSQ